MDRRRCLASLVVLAASAAAPEAHAALVIPYERGHKITIDGELNEPAWSRATRLSPFLIAGTQTEAPVQTRIRMFFDTDAIYLAAQCEDPDPSKLKITGDGRDDAHLWDGDLLEVFINPDDATYYQLVVNPRGVRGDLSYPAPPGRETTAWNADPDWTAATSIDEGGWQVEMKVPFAALWSWRYGPKIGEHFRLKICRRVVSKTGNTNDELSRPGTRCPAPCSTAMPTGTSCCWVTAI